MECAEPALTALMWPFLFIFFILFRGYSDGDDSWPLGEPIGLVFAGKAKKRACAVMKQVEGKLHADEICG